MDKLHHKNISLVSGIIFLLFISTITTSIYANQEQQQIIQNNETQQQQTQPRQQLSEAQKLDLATILANTNAELFNTISEITTECTYSTIAANSISDECFNFVKDVKNAVKPIVDKYESIITSSNIDSYSSSY